MLPRYSFSSICYITTITTNARSAAAWVDSYQQFSEASVGVIVRRMDEDEQTNQRRFLINWHNA